MNAVSQGAGLVFVGADDERVLLDNLRLTQTPAFLEPARAQGAYAIGKGRAVQMGKHPPMPYRVGWEVGYDYWQERLGRAVLWAADRAPELELSVEVAPRELLRADGPHPAVTVQWNGTASPTLKFSSRIRSSDGEVAIPLTDQRREEPDGTLVFEVPVLPAGEYHVDVRALSDRGVEGWATAPFSVTASRLIESFDLERSWGEVGETINGRMTLAGEPLNDEHVQARLIDPRGRILVCEEIAGEDAQFDFQFPIEPWYPMLTRVEAVVLDGHEEVATDNRFVNVVKRRRGQFNFLAWESPVGPMKGYVSQALAKLGVTVQLVWRNPDLEMAAHEIAWVPYSTRITADVQDNIMRPACWNDEPAINEHVQETVKTWLPSRRHGVFVYSLGDEVSTSGSCLHPACLAAYRRYLQGEYETIEALNASWGTQFNGFDEISPTDNGETEAQKQKNYPRWYDRGAFQRYNFTQLCKRFGDAYRAIDPKARTGFEGAGGFGLDYDLLMQTVGFWSPYPGPGDEILRSIAPPGFTRSNWFGYSKGIEPLFRKYWRIVTRGCDSVWWWMWPNVGTFNGLLRPTLEPYPAVLEMNRDTQIVRDGLGTLLMRSDMLDDGIAMLYNVPSPWAAGLESGPSYGNYVSCHKTWYRIIRGLGLQFSYVTDGMMRRGEFDTDRYKVLVLARSEALDPVTCETIRRFAEGGGTVIADLRPGRYDGHCKPLDHGGLDEMFGIRRASEAVDQEAGSENAVIDGSLAGQRVALTWQQPLCDPAVVVTEGETLGHSGSTPLTIMRKVGRGRAILLNFAIDTFPTDRNTEVGEPPADSQRIQTGTGFFRHLFASAGIHAAVTAADGHHPRQTEIVRWRNGETILLALFREGGEVEQANLELPQARHVYALRNRKVLGQVQSFTTSIIPNRATFFALTPAPVSPGQMTMADTKIKRGQMVELSLTCPGADGTRAVLVRVHDASGAEAKYLRQVIMVDRDGATAVLPIAYNDPPGKWTVTAVQLFTNSATNLSMNVK